MNIVFMGTPQFAVASLEMLIKEHNVLAVVTQPDRPKGRGKKLAFSPVKEVALANGIEVLQPVNVKDGTFAEDLRRFDADVFVVVAYGRILNEEVLNIPKYGCINVHGSLLPEYRGAGPIQWSIINGGTKTGVTTMYMEKGLDSGDMLLKTEMDILDDDTYGTLGERMSFVGAETLKETLIKLEEGTLKPEKQDHDKSTYAPMITKELERIDWGKSAKDIRNLIRGLNPEPGAYTVMNEEILKIWKAETVDREYDVPVGSIAEITKKGFVVKTGEKGLLVTEVQAKGGKKMPADAYMRGHKMEVGMTFSDNN
ncbi:MAG: methionyl-tRNA formyltransferase [Firmicutes bacterium]|nr:methionyl-tRNA formyltransferase [Bacillota bacterium]